MRNALVIDSAHLKRLVRLCRTIIRSQGLTVLALQTRFRTSRRTVFRDLNSLGDIGIPIELGEKGYRIRQSVSACNKLIENHYKKLFAGMLKTCLK